MDGTFDSYQADARRTRNAKLDLRESLSMLSMGMAGETGEAIDLLKKHLYHGHKLDDLQIAYEMGDVLWYLANVVDVLGIRLSDVALLNVGKLKARYPEGFSSRASQERAK